MADDISIILVGDGQFWCMVDIGGHFAVTGRHETLTDTGDLSVGSCLTIATWV